MFLPLANARDSVHLYYKYKYHLYKNELAI